MKTWTTGPVVYNNPGNFKKKGEKFITEEEIDK